MPSNVALRKHACQSSMGPWSVPGESSRAVNGVKTGGFGFHTDLEDNPWWQVDLEQTSLLTSVVVYNRGGAESEFAGRATNLTVRLSSDGITWQTIYTGNVPFGGVIDGAPLVIPCQGVLARFVHLQAQGRTYLHLDEVEVYAESIPFLTTPLVALGARHGTDKVSHGFCDIYDKAFAPIRLQATSILEIGVFFGASLKMWRDWCPNATVHGADHFTGHQGNGHVFPLADSFLREVEAGQHPRIVVHALDQSRREDLAAFRAQFLDGTFDIVIDDASHLMRDQQLTLAALFRLVKPGGHFVIEDLHSSNSEGYDVDPDGGNSTLRMVQNAIAGQGWSSRYMEAEDIAFLDRFVDFTQSAVHESSSGSLTCILRRCATVRNSSAPATVPGSVAMLNYASPDGYHQVLQQSHISWAKEWIDRSSHSSSLVCFGPNVLDGAFAKKNELILRYKFGGGHWLWKPYIIASMLASTSAEFIVYCDCSSMFKLSLDDTIRMLSSTGAALFAFSLTTTRDSPRMEYVWTKGQVLRAMNATAPEIANSNQIAATASVWRVCDETRELAAEWLRLMQDIAFATDVPSTDGKEAELFVRHRHDQSVFSILTKHMILKNTPERRLALMGELAVWVGHHSLSQKISSIHTENDPST